MTPAQACILRILHRENPTLARINIRILREGGELLPPRVQFCTPDEIEQLRSEGIEPVDSWPDLRWITQEESGRD